MQSYENAHMIGLMSQPSMIYEHMHNTAISQCLYKQITLSRRFIM